MRDLNSPDGLLRVNDRFTDNGRAYMPFSNDACVQESEASEPVPCFLAGDVRSTEVLPLASMHTMFVRLHNRVALELRRLNTHWDSDQVYQESRMIVAAIHQKINYLEYLPLILGSSGISASLFTFYVFQVCNFIQSPFHGL